MSSPNPAAQQAIAAEDPLTLFDAWLKEAGQSEPNDPNAARAAAAPSVRMVLIKPTGGHRFCFFTNAESQKGRELAENTRAALCFHWKSLRRQIRVEGRITELGPADVDAYFHSRGRKSQIGAAVSNQSRPLQSREALEAAAQAFAADHPGEIPPPAYWRGYHLHPHQIEFWIDGPNRLHDRFLFTQENDHWHKIRIYP